ncbi:MAG: hypothetical protein JO332_04340 [Planctomycetaceae bacterium]|nr:hypothetical protein [Planctomycetaceae bacterium]
MRRILPALFLGLLSMSPQDVDFNERLLRVLERRHRETPDPTDPRAAAARLGYDREKIRQFVSGLGWEPYTGILRDAAGTLLAGGGNSVDRALLLQTMLEAGGEKTRLMRADLPPAEGEKLLDSFRKRKAAARTPVDLKALAAELGVDPAGLEAALAARRREESALVQEVVDAAKVEAERVTPLIGPVKGRAAQLPKDHVWVQVADPAGKEWVDVDAAPVELAKGAGTPLAAGQLAALRRSLSFRLVLQRKSGAKTEPVFLLNVPADAAAAAWKPIEFVLLPLHGQLPPTGKLRDLEGKAQVDAFRQAKTFRAGLILDGKYYGGIPFDLSGELHEVDAGGRVGPAKALSGGVGKAFGGAFGGFGGGDDPKAPAASSIDSLVLEITVREPGVQERVHRRTVYTSAKPEDGISPFPVLRYSFLVDSAPLPEGERSRREIAAYVRNLPALRRLLKGELQGTHFSQQAEVSSVLLRFADARRRALAAFGDGASVLQDRPGICAETSQIALDDANGHVLLRRGIDILDASARFEDGPRTLSYGLAETALECLLVMRRWPGDAAPSAWTAMERARLQGGKPEVADQKGIKELRWSPAAWWSIDPTTGVCVGRVRSGAGQGLIETAWEEASAVCNYSDVTGLAAGAASATGHKEADDASAFFGKACGVVGGTWARDVAADKANDLTKDLWPSTIAALGGM